MSAADRNAILDQIRTQMRCISSLTKSRGGATTLGNRIAIENAIDSMRRVKGALYKQLTRLLEDEIREADNAPTQTTADTMSGTCVKLTTNNGEET